MRVILKTEVRGLGRPGEVKDVADGYARNYLLPKGLAIEATGGELKHLAQARESAKTKRDRAHADAEDLARRLHEVTLVFKLKAGGERHEGKPREERATLLPEEARRFARDLARVLRASPRPRAA